MSSDPRRADVVVAEYLYRHEAEFAAGFLTDAGIPFRLATDDAGGVHMALTISRPARLYVRATDAEEARELLEVTAGTGMAHDGTDPAVDLSLPKPATGSPVAGDLPRPATEPVADRDLPRPVDGPPIEDPQETG